jgi:hypothetical protein
MSLNNNIIISNNSETITDVPNNELKYNDAIINNIVWNNNLYDSSIVVKSTTPFDYVNHKKILIKINGEDVNFNISEKIGNTGLYFVDEQKKYFMKIPLKYLEYDILKREIHALKILNKHNKYFPKLILCDDICIITEYVGEPINKNNIPSDILFQLNEILNILKDENMIHSDIKKEEILVNGNKIFLVDFGWTKINNSWGCDINLCSKEKPFLNDIFDKYKIMDVLLEILNE